MYRIDLSNWKTDRVDFWHVGIFLVWLGQVQVLEKLHGIDEVMTYGHIFESVKNHIKAYISRAKIDRTLKN